MRELNSDWPQKWEVYFFFFFFFVVLQLAYQVVELQQQIKIKECVLEEQSVRWMTHKHHTSVDTCQILHKYMKKNFPSAHTEQTFRKLGLKEGLWHKIDSIWDLVHLS